MDGKRWIAGLLAALFWISSAAAATAGSEAVRTLEEIRNRIRVEAGVCEVPTTRGADLPMVPVTVLPDDTHARLAVELTGNGTAEGVLRKIEPRLHPGRRVYIPRALLSPRLADSRSESLFLGPTYPTLWSLTKKAAVSSGAGLPATVRNLQRLNGIPDPTRLRKGAGIQVPQSLLKTPNLPAPPRLNVRKDFRVTNLRGLDRRADSTDFPRDLRNKLQQQRRWKRQLGPRAVDLVVIHATEHGEAPFQNVARYLQRKRLTHYLVARDGTVYEIVPESNKAHGAGQSLWEGRYAVDHESINIEIFANTAPNQYKSGITQAQYRSTKELLANIRSRRPAIHGGRIVTHRMVAVSYKYGTRARKGDPYEFDWAAAGLSDNSQLIDQDVLLRRIRPCTDARYVDRVTEGQNAASRFLHTL